ncbi:RCC1/BLIP-II [Xylariaceae sp. FL0804]|nr:RCC1/BLIP-II [Xylariaceae sp. FL0804]
MMDGLFALGSNGSGQLGLGHREDVSVPKQVQFLGEPSPNDQVAHIAAGGNHTILLTASGRAYWSGDPAAATGSCGIVTASGVAAGPPVFREVVVSTRDDGPAAARRRILHVACTWDATVFVLEDDSGRATQVYYTGGASEEEGEAGAAEAATGGGSAGTTRTEGGPMLLPDFPPRGTAVRALAAGFRHVVAVLDNGDVYGWGSGRKGQLGTLADDDGPKGLVRRPRRIAGVEFSVDAAVCCQYTTCLVAGPGDGRIVLLGADKWGLKAEAPVEVPNWKAVTASWGGIYILRRDGTVVAWGRDDHGQLPPPGLPEVESVVAGSEHVLALTAEGDVLAWGWGEHGNCGPTSQKFGDVKGRWNILASLKNLSEGSAITLVGGGCATSWINIVADGVFL